MLFVFTSPCYPIILWKSRGFRLESGARVSSFWDKQRFSQRLEDFPTCTFAGAHLRAFEWYSQPQYCAPKRGAEGCKSHQHGIRRKTSYVQEPSTDVDIRGEQQPGFVS